MRDDNSEWKQQQDEEEWHEKNRRILDEFDNVRPLIIGNKNDKERDTECAKTPI